jgi:hypothetical protein
MATCAHCNTQETELYEYEVPICLDCMEARTGKRKPPASEKNIRAILLQEVFRTTALCEEAAREFDKVAGQSPTRLPHPDGGQSIINAARKLTVARNDVLTAHNRLNNFLEQEDVPAEDLKRRSATA